MTMNGDNLPPPVPGAFNLEVITDGVDGLLVAHGDKAYIQAGAGIVADSVPESEYQETLNKARRTGTTPSIP